VLDIERLPCSDRTLWVPLFANRCTVVLTQFNPVAAHGVLLWSVRGAQDMRGDGAVQGHHGGIPLQQVPLADVRPLRRSGSTHRQSLCTRAKIFNWEIFFKLGETLLASLKMMHHQNLSVVHSAIRPQNLLVRLCPAAHPSTWCCELLTE
jgi:hypothetical protein